jgi:hypothetical protein
MSNGILAFIAGLGTGYVNQSRYNDEKERQAKLDQVTLDKAADDKATRQRQLAGDQALADAGKTAAVEPNVANDDDGNPTSAPPVRVIGPGPGQAFADPAAAQAAAAATNAQPVRARQIQALNGIDPERAAKLEAETQTTQAGQIKIDAAKQEAADKLWQRAVGSALSSPDPHAALAGLINNTEVGVMQGRTVKPMPSADGKSVTYALVSPDGTTSPTNLTFSNDMPGAIQAAYMLDRTVTPEHRIELALKVEKNKADVAEAGAKKGYWESFAAQKDALTANGGAAPKKADHFDDKQWDAASKIDKDLVGIPDPTGGDKPTQSGDLRSRRMQVFNDLRTRGDLSPQEAAEKADTFIVNVKNSAMQLWTDAHAADKKATLTIDQAIKQVLKEADARAKAAAAKPAGEPGSAPGIRINAGEQAARDGDSLGILQQELGKSSQRLAAVKADPQATPDDLARAQQEVDGLNRELARRQKTARAGVKPAAASPVPAAKVAAAGVAPVPAQPTGPGPELDSARTTLQQAQAALLTYSPRKQAQDPQGFAAAKAAVAQAQQRAAQAEAAWQQSVGTMPASTARPGLHL